MEANLATTYTLIHAFLTKHSHSKAADALKKAARGVVVLKDGIETEGPQLDEIIQQWKTMTAKRLKEDGSSDDTGSESSDSDDSSSDSSSNDSKLSTATCIAGSSTNAKFKMKAPPVPTTSSSSSSESESANNVKKASKREKLKQVGKKASKASESESESSSSSSSDSGPSSGSSSDSSDSDSDSDDEPVNKKTANSVETLPKSSQNRSETMSSGDSSDDSSSDSSSDSENEKVKNKISEKESKTKQNKAAVSKRKEKKAETSDSDSDSSDSNSDTKETSPATEEVSSIPPTNAKSELLQEDVKATKKRRISEGGAGVATAVVSTARVELETAPTVQRKEQEKEAAAKNGRRTNERFQRVDPNKVTSQYVIDNRYENKAAPKNDYGAKAHADLIVTRGAGFRKEKNKKKRGSYKGGEITMESHSFKFT
ncbi:hypothetical protein E1B28_009234 [Marasmius oreades]|uniref:Srp40 C-terminal domain-containing protein n=1 Tax=Marasmius oreades TaxID=181124 RepID=A0A9P7UV36_9AGAR|nr:uncharacterized protein E1B28_009234 [Marasmius oreades]KAG7092929.1 hypothetical protein E1B28_009234 [Marasmius oreades]